jgi:hypothetical protein
MTVGLAFDPPFDRPSNGFDPPFDPPFDRFDPPFDPPCVDPPITPRPIEAGLGPGGPAGSISLQGKFDEVGHEFRDHYARPRARPTPVGKPASEGAICTNRCQLLGESSTPDLVSRKSFHYVPNYVTGRAI